ncbi:hypothetical protein EU803_10235 [Loktanella sp. IMCC34160]|uniref:MotE family protein n=1 Tax=Loktanella sp. IMCC34160 TaxID=2510646 RepID=UPI00101CC290|nr:hypothetical protein [Loktanella sp. IMCC34160]RYG91460.1 hypothetical protein EU803_10235 [Loktanella sp. IMCC34160]
MTRATQVKRRPKGVLLILAALLVGSGVLRIGDSAGQAIAGGSQQSERSEPVAEGPSECLTERDASALLEAFRDREAQVAERENRVEDRLQALRVAEAQIEQRLQELRAAEEALAATLSLADTAAETDLEQLTQVYQNMKPRDAAALFEEMSPDFAAGFLGRMRPDAAAAVMAGLEPGTAYSISVVLAGRNANVPSD